MREWGTDEWEKMYEEKEPPKKSKKEPTREEIEREYETVDYMWRKYLVDD